MKPKYAKELSQSKPDLWYYADSREFVADLCAWKKRNEKGFSFRKLAQLADLGSPNYVQTYVSGARNLSRRTAERLAEALYLKGDEIEYFMLMLNLTQADEPEEKRKWYEELLAAAVRKGTGVLDRARLDYFSEWYIPVVHAMASLTPFYADSQWISKRIYPRISEEQGTRALRTLQTLEILLIDKKGKVAVREPRLATEPGLRSIWIREYHRAMIGLSLRSIDLWPPEKRTTSALTVTVPEEEIHTILNWVDEYRQTLFARIMALQKDTDQVKGEVMQINFQAFLLTRDEDTA